MRPAQKAPENRGAQFRSGRPFGGFNEAGAKSAGKRSRSFRCPFLKPLASMRPAQKAPENKRDEAEAQAEKERLQ